MKAPFITHKELKDFEKKLVCLIKDISCCGEGGNQSAFEDSPYDDTIYGRRNGQWTRVTPGITEHNALSGKQGGDSVKNEFYHLDKRTYDNIQELLDSTPSPDYFPMEIRLSIAPEITVYERGANLTINFIRDILTQGDAGSITGEVIKISEGNQNPYSHPPDDPFKIYNGQDNFKFIWEVSHAQGPCKNNKLNEEDCKGRIEAGTVQSNTVEIIPKLKIFYGNFSVEPMDSIQARSLPQNSWESVNSFILQTGNINKSFAVFIPFSKSILKIEDEGNLYVNITEEYELISDNFQIKDAGGNSHRYKKYIMKNDIPYLIPTEHKITIA